MIDKKQRQFIKILQENGCTISEISKALNISQFELRRFFPWPPEMIRTKRLPRFNENRIAALAKNGKIYAMNEAEKEDLNNIKQMAAENGWYYDCLLADSNSLLFIEWAHLLGLNYGDFLRYCVSFLGAELAIATSPYSICPVFKTRKPKRRLAKVCEKLDKLYESYSTVENTLKKHNENLKT